MGRVMFKRIKQKVNNDAALLHRGRFVNLDFLVGVGDTDYVVAVREGRIEPIEERRLPTHTGVFSVHATTAAWEAHWQLMPRRGRHDLFSMVADGAATFEGNLLPLMQNLQYFKDVLASPRRERREG